jgi:hypothetical protein
MMMTTTTTNVPDVVQSFPQEHVGLVAVDGGQRILSMAISDTTKGISLSGTNAFCFV